MSFLAATPAMAIWDAALARDGARAAPIDPLMAVEAEAESSASELLETISSWEEKSLQESASEEEQDEEMTLEELVAEFERIEGLFTFYRNPETGGLYMAVRDDQFDRDFIYFSHTLNGAPYFLHWVGFYRSNSIMSFRRYYDRVEIHIENTSYYFDPDSPLAKAKDANVVPAIAFATKVEATSADGTTSLIPVGNLFMSEVLDPIRPPSRSFSPTDFGLGKLNLDKSKIQDVRAYPENVDVVVDYSYDKPLAFSFGTPPPGVTDWRYATVKVQHSFIALPPEDGFTPRFSDQRIGYFLTQVTDQTEMQDATPYRDLVHRWRLEKKDPDAALSEPVKPITFWIENTTPLEYRETVRDATLRWNEAFEKAGFKNAIAVEVQPDDAEWDAGDIRYNVLRWTASPRPPFGGYGPSFVNPRTGEIIGADIMLELAYLTNRTRLTEIYGGDASALLPARDPRIEAALEQIDAAALSPAASAITRQMGRFRDVFGGSPQQDALLPLRQFDPASRTGLASGDMIPRPFCLAGQNMRMELGMGMAALQAAGAPEAEQEALIEQGLYELILHEVGHTLGLNHNMKASQIHPLEDIHDKEKTGEVLIGSVMDYSAVNIAPKGEAQGQYYSTRVGPYDMWAIEFGYKPGLEGEAREAVLARSTDPLVTFGNDADDMRSIGFGGIDPRVMIDDMSGDAVGYAAQRIGLIDATVKELKTKFTQAGESWEKMRDAYLTLLIGKLRSGLVAANYVGGIKVERFVAGQDGSQELTPYEPLTAEVQKKAITVLRDGLFAPDAFEVDPELARYMQVERRDFELFGRSEDLKYHDFVLITQDIALAQLTSPPTMQRLTDGRLYGNDYEPIAFLKDLNKAIFEAEQMGNVNTFRQNLQIRYVKRLLVMALLPFYGDVTQSAAMAALRDVNAQITPAFFGIGQPELNEETKAHRRHLKRLLRFVEIF